MNYINLKFFSCYFLFMCKRLTDYVIDFDKVPTWMCPIRITQEQLSIITITPKPFKSCRVKTNLLEVILTISSALIPKIIIPVTHI